MKKSAQQLCDEWNESNPIGTPVLRYRLIKPNREPVETVTRSQAFVCPAGYGVIFVKSIAGWVVLESVEPLVEKTI